MVRPIGRCLVAIRLTLKVLADLPFLSKPPLRLLRHPGFLATLPFLQKQRSYVSDEAASNFSDRGAGI
jgi:hypothetical protein